MHFAVSHLTDGYYWRTQKCRNLSSLHAFFEGKNLGNLRQEKALLEPRNRFANSIRTFFGNML